MLDCTKDICAFHDNEVTLLQPQRIKMRNHRNANRDRLKTRLKADSKPTPREFITQGSYPMLTMVQDPDYDYDIDDGIYFTRESLQDKDGKDMVPKDARQMVCDALRDGRFLKQPQVKRSCVRIFYNEGYHVDMPVYRVMVTLLGERYELAAGEQWVESRAADVEDWFYSVNQSKSPDESNGRQFRRIVRMLKKFARSRKVWKDQIASGFTITKLAAECYVANNDREDIALRETMKRMRTRLMLNLEVDHPVTPGAKLTKGPSDKTTTFFRDKLDEALKEVEVLDDQKCTRERALKAWDKVFNTEFFSVRYKGEEKAGAAANIGILANLVATKQNPRAVDKRGGGRFA